MKTSPKRWERPSPTKKWNTVGGWLMHLTGRVPAPGESLTHGRFLITVIEGTPSRIDKIRLDVSPPGHSGRGWLGPDRIRTEMTRRRGFLGFLSQVWAPVWRYFVTGLLVWGAAYYHHLGVVGLSSRTWASDSIRRSRPSSKPSRPFCERVDWLSIAAPLFETYPGDGLHDGHRPIPRHRDLGPIPHWTQDHRLWRAYPGPHPPDQQSYESTAPSSKSATSSCPAKAPYSNTRASSNTLARA